MPVNAIFDLGSTLIKRLFPDKAEQDKAQYRLIELQQQGRLKQLDAQMGAIVAEAKSKDKWTSRARPTFLYVMYIMILLSIPMAIMHAYNPGVARNLEEGMRAYLGAIPNPLWMLFGGGYLGYAGTRSYDKKKLADAMSKMGMEQD